MDYPFQASIVGRTTIPAGVDRSKFSFLKDMLKTLEEGQAIRLVLPSKDSTKGTVQSAWSRICKGKGHSRVQKQKDGSCIIWLWCDKR